MRTITDWQKYLIVGSLAGAGLGLSIMRTSAGIGFANAERILNLASEIGPEKTIHLLEGLIHSTVIRLPA